MEKKAQIKMFETISILFVFLILVALGLVFYSFIQKSSLEAEAEQSAVLRAVQIAEKVSFLPEIQCSNDNIPVPDCVDVFKLEAFVQGLEDNNVFYFPLFGNSEVIVRQIYPSSKNWTVYSGPGALNVKKSHIPVNIFNPVDDKYSFGILEVSVFLR